MLQRIDPEQHYRDRVARAVAAIVADPTAAHSLADLAAIANFSPFHFHRIYRGVTGETVAATVRRLRLARAAQLLASGVESVTQVAMAVGYDSPQAFSRAFREFAGIAPRAFQRERGLAGLGLTPPPPESGASELAVELVERTPQQVYALVHRGPPSTIPHSFWRVMKIAGDWPVRACIGVASGDGMHGSVSPDGGFEYHVAVALECVPPRASELVAMTLAGGRYARHTLTGPYTQINAAISALYSAWLPQSGFEPDDRPVLEIYRSPFGTPPQDLQTDLLIPVRDLT